MTRVALYARVSTVEQAEGHSIDAQLECLRDWANEHSQVLHEEYVDAGLPGDSDERPALRRLLADARGSCFDGVLVYRFDRISRDVRLFLNLEHELRQRGIRLVSITEAIDDTHEGRLQLLIKGSFAEYEKAVIRERANLGRIRAARQGKWMGGSPPYGYTLDRQTSKLVIDLAEASWVRKYYKWLVEDRLTLKQLQRRVNDLRVPNKRETFERKRPVNRDGWWKDRTLGRILTRELYTGVYNYRRICKPRSVKYRDATIRPEEDWIPIAVPAIIDRELFDRAQAQLRKNSDLAARRTNRPYLLRRTLECGTCGRAWVAMRNNYDRPYYICSGRRGSVTSERCTRPAITAAALEPAVWDSLVELLKHPELVLRQVRARLDGDGTRQKAEAAFKRLTGRIRRATQEETRLARAYKKGALSLKALSAEQQETRERIARWEVERRKLQAQIGPGFSHDTQLAAVERLSRQILATLPRLTYERRCELVRQLVDRVVLAEDRIEVQTLVPAGETGGLQDAPGVDRLANHRMRDLPLRSIDPTNVVRITLFAALPDRGRPRGLRPGTRKPSPHTLQPFHKRVA